MADKKISELTLISTIADGDLMEIEDIDAAVDDQNKKITIAELKNALIPTITEGTWTPTEQATGTDISSVSGKYVKKGAVVYCWCQFTVDNAPSGTNPVKIFGIPYTIDDTYGSAHGVFIEETGGTQYTVSNTAANAVTSEATFFNMVGKVCNMSFKYLTNEFVG